MYSQQQNEMIQNAIGPGLSEEVISKCNSISLKRCDFWTLKDLGWLNDQVSVAVLCVC